jgi:hypothetical protein
LKASWLSSQPASEAPLAAERSVTVRLSMLNPPYL